MRAVVRKGLKEEAKGKKPVFLIRGQRVDLESAFGYFKRKHVADLAEMTTESAPSTPEEVRSYSPMQLTPGESDVATATADSEPHDHAMQAASLVLLNPVSAPPKPKDANSHHREFETRPTQATYESFRNWYMSLSADYFGEDQGFLELADLPPAPARGLSSPDNFRIIEGIISVAQDIKNDRSSRIFFRDNRLIRAIKDANHHLIRADYCKALETQKYTAGMITDLVRKRPFDLMTDLISISSMFHRSLATEYSILPILMYAFKASLCLHGSRHPLVRAIKTVIDTYRLGLSPAFRTHLFVQYLKHVTQTNFARHDLLFLLYTVFARRDSAELAPIGHCVELIEYMEKTFLDPVLAARVETPRLICLLIIQMARNWISAGEFDRGASILNEAWSRALKLRRDCFHEVRYEFLYESARSLELQGRLEEAIGKMEVRLHHAKEDFGIKPWRADFASRDLERLERIFNDQGLQRFAEIA